MKKKLNETKDEKTLSFKKKIFSCCEGDCEDEIQEMDTENNDKLRFDSKRKED